MVVERRACHGAPNDAGPLSGLSRRRQRARSIPPNVPCWHSPIRVLTNCKPPRKLGTISGMAEQLSEATWLHCRACHAPLVPIVVRDGRTALDILGGMILVTRAELRCRCGTLRTFVSVAASPNPGAGLAVDASAGSC